MFKKTIVCGVGALYLTQSGLSEDELDTITLVEEVVVSGSNVCDREDMFRIKLAPNKAEMIVHKPKDGDRFKGVVCADLENASKPNQKGLVYLYFDQNSPISTGANQVGSLDGNTCMMIHAVTHVYAIINTKAGGKACMKSFGE